MCLNSLCNMYRLRLKPITSMLTRRVLDHNTSGLTRYSNTTKFVICGPALQMIALLALEKRLICVLWNPIAPVTESPDSSPASIQAGRFLQTRDHICQEKDGD